MMGDDELKLLGTAEFPDADMLDEDLLEDIDVKDDGCHDLLSSGDVVDGWQVKNLIGISPTAEVYRAEKNGEAVALKILKDERESSRRRFAEEIVLLRDLALPCLPHFIASGEYQNHPYFISEMLEEVEQPFESFDAIKDYLLSVCDAVSRLHAKGYIHRDLKPGNIMRRANGEIVLIDLGLVKPVSGSAIPRNGFTIVDGKIVGSGTPGYAAPEQLQGGRIGPEADIHALGMLARDAFIECRNHCAGWNDPIPEILQDVIHRAICSAPEERYPSVAAFAAAIRKQCKKGKSVLWRRLLGGLLLLGFAAISFGIWWNAVGREKYAWHRLATETVIDEIEQELLWERLETNVIERAGQSWQIVAPVRCFRTVTNHFAVTEIHLNNESHVFKDPITLAANRTYRIIGPGVFDAELKSAGNNTTVRLCRCNVQNRTKQTLKEGGISYRVEEGGYLNFVNLTREENQEAIAGHIQIDDGAFCEVRFGGPETIEGLMRAREAESRQRMNSIQESWNDSPTKTF